MFNWTIKQSNYLTIMEKVKQEVRKFMEERDWLDQAPADLAKSVIIEAAELLEHFQWDNHSKEKIVNDAELMREIVHELADVFIYAVALTVVLDVDAEKIVHDKLLISGKKYPAGIVNGEKGKEKYRQIKKRFRAKK
jgi:NTP pyrophosphatase (non-canonical NTP hydrolase)